MRPYHCTPGVVIRFLRHAPLSTTKSAARQSNSARNRPTDHKTDGRISAAEREAETGRE